MELVRYLIVLRRRWKTIVAAVLVAVAAAYLLTPGKHRYQATSKLYVGSRAINFDSPGLAFGAVQSLDRILQTFGDMIHSRPIAERALARAGISRSTDTVLNETTVRQLPNAQLLAIDVADRNANAARQLANALADTFVDQVKTFEPTRPAAAGEVPALPAYVFERARLPSHTKPTGLLLNLVVAAILGFAVAVAGVLLADYLDLTVRGVEDAERRLELPVLGAIPDFGRAVPREPAEGSRAKIGSS